MVQRREGARRRLRTSRRSFWPYQPAGQQSQSRSSSSLQALAAAPAGPKAALVQVIGAPWTPLLSLGAQFLWVSPWHSAAFAAGFVRADPGVVDAGECHILSDCFGYAMQALLLFICSSALLTKWFLEVPRRLFLVFLLDVSKQVIGAFWYHWLNMCVAWYLGDIGTNVEADECAWYFINFMVDTTFGLLMNVTFVRLSERLIGYDSGNYCSESDDVGELDWGKWRYQMSIYLGIVTISKACVLILILAFLPFWAAAGVSGTTWLEDVEERLFFVMVLVPAVMDTFFFCVIDEVIKEKPEPVAKHDDPVAKHELAKSSRSKK